MVGDEAIRQIKVRVGVFLKTYGIASSALAFSQ